MHDVLVFVALDADREDRTAKLASWTARMVVLHMAHGTWRSGDRGSTPLDFGPWESTR